MIFGENAFIWLFKTTRHKGEHIFVFFLVPLRSENITKKLWLVIWIVVLEQRYDVAGSSPTWQYQIMRGATAGNSHGWSKLILHQKYWFLVSNTQFKLLNWIWNVCSLDFSRRLQCRFDVVTVDSHEDLHIKSRVDNKNYLNSSCYIIHLTANDPWFLVFNIQNSVWCGLVLTATKYWHISNFTLLGNPDFFFLHSSCCHPFLSSSPGDS